VEIVERTYFTRMKSRAYLGSFANIVRVTSLPCGPIASWSSMCISSFFQSAVTSSQRPAKVEVAQNQLEW